MVKVPLHAGLGSALRAIRKKRGITQAELANATELSTPTIRLLERGSGRVSSLLRVLHELELSLVGRNLPSGSTVGQQIAILRKRRGLTQQDVADLVRVSRPTISALEYETRGRVATLEGVLRVLGAGASLAKQGSERQFFTGCAMSNVYHGWSTPQWLLDQLYTVVGGFDLDPCASTANRRRATVRARLHYTADDDGLRLHWHGVVFVNPPYGRALKHWTAKARGEIARGHATLVIALLPARTDTVWWHVDVAGHADVFLLRGRLKYGNGDQAAPFPSALVVWGASPGLIARLRTTFKSAWHIPAHRVDRSTSALSLGSPAVG